MNETRKSIPTYICRDFINQLYYDLAKCRNSTQNPELVKQIDATAHNLELFEEQVGKYEYFEPNPKCGYE